MKKRLLLDKLILILLILYPLYYNFFAGTMLNTIIVILLFLSNFYDELRRKKYFTIGMKLLFFILIIINLYISKNSYYTFLFKSNELFSYSVKILLIFQSIYYCENILNNKLFFNNKMKSIVYKIFIIEIVFIEIVNLYLILSRKGFVFYWDSIYYGGFQGHPHGAAYNMLSLIIIINAMIIYYKKRQLILLEIIPLLAIALSGARLIMFISLLLLIGIFNESTKNKLLIKISLVLFIIVGLVLFKESISKLPFITKSNNYSSLLQSQNNSRGVFWNNAFESIKTGNIKKQFLGFGTLYSYKINYDYFGVVYWSHNDLIDVLVSYGIVGLILYMISLFKYIKLNLNLKNKYVKFYLGSLAITMFFNGLFNFSFGVILIYQILLKEDI